MNSGTVTVGTSPTLICKLGTEGDDTVIQNTGTNPVFVGGANVAASGAAAGVSVAAGATLTVPGTHVSAPYAPGLYGVVASGTTTVAYLAPGD